MNKIPNKPVEEKIDQTVPVFSKKHRMSSLIRRLKKLKGDPHDVALGMAVGVFISLTPTIPFHTALAVIMAIILRGSKAAAAIGVWFSNPVTIPFFYLGSYKVGTFLLGNSIPFDQKYDSILELAQIGIDATLAMLIGGIIIGIPPALLAYVITKKMFIKIHLKRAKSRQKKKDIITDTSKQDVTDPRDVTFSSGMTSSSVVTESPEKPNIKAIS